MRLLTAAFLLAACTAVGVQACSTFRGYYGDGCTACGSSCGWWGLTVSGECYSVAWNIYRSSSGQQWSGQSGKYDGANNQVVFYSDSGCSSPLYTYTSGACGSCFIPDDRFTFNGDQIKYTMSLNPSDLDWNSTKGHRLPVAPPTKLASGGHH